eukprot:snap_masked-scaffold_33-processed-gene-3.38-mRNA-1 protein AED:1.00 eAED:1.00 QI:0/-1/0/0/-1/1/1/0/651
MRLAFRKFMRNLQEPTQTASNPKTRRQKNKRQEPLEIMSPKTASVQPKLVQLNEKEKLYLDKTTKTFKKALSSKIQADNQPYGARNENLTSSPKYTQLLQNLTLCQNPREQYLIFVALKKNINLLSQYPLETHFEALFTMLFCFDFRGVDSTVCLSFVSFLKALVASNPSFANPVFNCLVKAFISDNPEQPTLDKSLSFVVHGCIQDLLRINPSFSDILSRIFTLNFPTAKNKPNRVIWSYFNEVTNLLDYALPTTFKMQIWQILAHFFLNKIHGSKLVLLDSLFLLLHRRLLSFYVTNEDSFFHVLNVYQVLLKSYFAQGGEIERIYPFFVLFFSKKAKQDEFVDSKYYNKASAGLVKNILEYSLFSNQNENINDSKQWEKSLLLVTYLLCSEYSGVHSKVVNWVLKNLLAFVCQYSVTNFIQDVDKTRYKIEQEMCSLHQEYLCTWSCIATIVSARENIIEQSLFKDPFFAGQMYSWQTILGKTANPFEFLDSDAVNLRALEKKLKLSLNSKSPSAKYRQKTNVLNYDVYDDAQLREDFVKTREYLEDYGVEETEDEEEFDLGSIRSIEINLPVVENEVDDSSVVSDISISSDKVEYRMNIGELGTPIARAKRNRLDQVHGSLISETSIDIIPDYISSLASDSSNFLYS